MEHRIAIWAGAGFIIAVCWAVYAFAAPVTSAQSIAVTFAELTQPVVLVGSYLHFGLHVWWIVLANTATYGFMGLMVEALRHKLSPSR